MREHSPRNAAQARQSFLRAAILTGGLIICLATAWSLIDRRTAVGQTKVDVSNLSRSIAEHTHDSFQLADTILVGLRERVAVDGLGPDSVARLNRLLAKRSAVLPLIHFLVVIGPDGKPLAASQPLPKSLNYSDRPYFQRAKTFDLDQPVFAGPLHSKLDGSWIVIVSRRLNDPSGHFAGVALATISLTYFQRFYDSFDIGAQGVISLATDQGVLVTRRPFVDANIGRDLSTSELYRHSIRPAGSGSFTYRGVLDGIVRIGSFHRVEGFPLFVVVARERAQALAVWRRQTLGMLVAVVAVELAIALIARHVMGQLGQVMEAERQLQRAHSDLLRSEARLSEGNRWLELAEQIGNVGHWRMALPDMTLYWSAEVFRIMGLPPSRMPPSLETAFASYHPDDHETVRRAIAAAIADGGPLETNFRIVRPSGEIRFLRSRGLMQRDQDGKAVSLFGVCLDRTEQEQVEVVLREAQRVAEAEARKDGLTGLASRRAFDETLEVEYRRAARTSTHLALLMVDVDNFKIYNDTYGHPQGDRCLQTLAAVLETMLRRPADLAARYGGEEMAVLLPDTDLEGAYQIATRAVERVAALRLPHSGAAGGVVTVSIGVCAVIADPALSARDTLLVPADQALYRAKYNGRGRVERMELTEQLSTARA